MIRYAFTIVAQSRKRNVYTEEEHIVLIHATKKRNPELTDRNGLFARLYTLKEEELVPLINILALMLRNNMRAMININVVTKLAIDSREMERNS